MAEVSIPGVSNKYKTNELVESLIEVEKVPLKYEQKTLDSYKLEKECLQRVNQYMTSVRDSARGLFSYNNPFNEKTVESSDDSVATATADRDAISGTYKVEVEQVAAADKFLSNKVQNSFTVQAGKYTFKVGDKSISFNWKGGTLTDFVDSLNKRGKDVLKATIVNVNSSSKVFSIESLKTGETNALSFEDDALSFAAGIGIIQVAGKNQETQLLKSSRDLSTISLLKADNVSLKSGTLIVPPQNGVAITLPQNLNAEDNSTIFLTVNLKEVQDITENQVIREEIKPELPLVGSASLDEIVVSNEQLDTDLPELPKQEPLKKIENYSIVYAKKANGTEVSLGQLDTNEETQTISIKLTEHPDITGIIIKNFNTGKQVSVSNVRLSQNQNAAGIIALNPVSQAQDAKIKYEGISMTRDTNQIDDIIPNVKLNLEQASKKPVTLTIDTNSESIKDSIIEFAGKYNRLMAELNILTQTKEAIVTEIEYFTEEEEEAALERLGLFQGDFTLTQSKQSLQTAMAQAYDIKDNDTIKMLSQVGISTNASSGSSINSSQMRGYLEIDEKKLDEALANNINEIKNIFGYDSDEDKVIDTGIAFNVDKNLSAYTQIGGIIASKTSSLDTKMKNSETKIKKLETQIADKESELKQKYSQMESTLNSLESQVNSINNTFNNKNNN